MPEVAVEPWGPVEEMLRAAACGPDQVSAAVERLGVERTTDVIADEVAMRVEPPALDSAVRFQLEVTFGGASAIRTVTLDQGKASVGPGSPDADALVRFDAVDLVESLFGATWRMPHTSREVVWADRHWQQTTTFEGGQRTQQLVLAMDALIAACSSNPVDLGRLSARHGSDKWGSLHWYTQHYEQHFARFRDEPVRVLEIGIGGYQFPDQGGASLRSWQRYFRRGLVYGLDIFEKPGVRGPRMRAVQGDQSDPEFLDELGRRLGPFDIVIDDGSHVNEHVTTSFAALLPHVRPGGLYVIEDLQTAYWPGFGGNDQDLVTADTSVTMLKGLIDGLNHQELPEAARRNPSYTDRTVVGLHFYHNLAIVEKGLNAEGGIPPFIKNMFSGKKNYTGGAVDFGDLTAERDPAG